MTENEFISRHKTDVLMVCHNIRLLRSKYKLSQAEMAKRLEIGVQTLRSLEKDRIPPRLSCGILCKIYKEFGIWPSDMFSPLEDKK